MRKQALSVDRKIIIMIKMMMMMMNIVIAIGLSLEKSKALKNAEFLSCSNSQIRRSRMRQDDQFYVER